MPPRKDPYALYRKNLIRLLEGEGLSHPHDAIYLDMLLNVERLREEDLDTSELRLLNTALKELRYAMKVFKSFRGIPKAAVFGSARTPRNHPHYKIAEQFGRKLAKQGWMIITGGASGIMEAAMVGAGAGHSFGLNILLPFEQEPNYVIRGNKKLMYFKYFFTRKLMFLKESEATVLFPGGFGTFDEGFESFTLVQTGKAKPRPLVLVDAPGDVFWSSMMGFFKSGLRDGKFIDPGDLGLMRHFQDTTEAVKEIKRFYRNYHSSRFLDQRYLIRLRKPLSAAQLEDLGGRFKPLLTQGLFELMGPEKDDIHDASLTRLVFSFDRHNYSGLRALIDHLNTL